MDFKDDFVNGVKLVASATSDICSAIAEKNRLRADANRIRQVIKSESELRTQAYIELGRYFYDNLRDGANEENEGLCVVIDKTTAKINNASLRYVELINKCNDTKLSSQNTEKIKNAVTKTATDIKESTTDTVNKIKDKAVDFSTEKAQKAKDFTADKTKRAKQLISDIKDDIRSRVLSHDELEAMIEEHEAILAELEAQKANEVLNSCDDEADTKPEDTPQVDILQEDTPQETTDEAPIDTPKAEVEAPLAEREESDEESPDEFSF